MRLKICIGEIWCAILDASMLSSFRVMANYLYQVIKIINTNTFTGNFMRTVWKIEPYRCLIYCLILYSFIVIIIDNKRCVKKTQEPVTSKVLHSLNQTLIIPGIKLNISFVFRHKITILVNLILVFKVIPFLHFALCIYF